MDEDISKRISELCTFVDNLDQEIEDKSNALQKMCNRRDRASAELTALLEKQE